VSTALSVLAASRPLSTAVKCAFAASSICASSASLSEVAMSYGGGVDGGPGGGRGRRTFIGGLGVLAASRPLSTAKK
jgi:hypothetical protein